MKTHISLTFEGAVEQAIIDALRESEYSQYDEHIMDDIRIDTQPDGRTMCACGETSGVVASVVIDGQWHTGYAGYCESCGNDDYDGSTIDVTGTGRYRRVAPKVAAE